MLLALVFTLATFAILEDVSAAGTPSQPFLAHYQEDFTAAGVPAPGVFLETLCPQVQITLLSCFYTGLYEDASIRVPCASSAGTRIALQAPEISLTTDVSHRVSMSFTTNVACREGVRVGVAGGGVVHYFVVHNNVEAAVVLTPVRVSPESGDSFWEFPSPSVASVALEQGASSLRSSLTLRNEAATVTHLHYYDTVSIPTLLVHIGGACGLGLFFVLVFSLTAALVHIAFMWRAKAVNVEVKEKKEEKEEPSVEVWGGEVVGGSGGSAIFEGKQSRFGGIPTELPAGGGGRGGDGKIGRPRAATAVEVRGTHTTLAGAAAEGWGGGGGGGGGVPISSNVRKASDGCTTVDDTVLSGF